MKKIIIFLLLIVLIGIFVFLGWSKLGAFFCNQGNYYFERQDYKKAVVAYKNSLRVNPRAWMAHLGLAEVYLANKDYQASAQEYRNVLSINPFCARAYESLSYIYCLQGDYEKALQILARGLKENPVDEKIKLSVESCCYSYFANVLNKSTELFLAQKPKEAIFELESVLRQCPGNALAYYTLGYYYFSSRDYINAQVNLDKCIVMDPQFHYAYKLLSDIYFKKGNIEKAVLYAQERVAIDNQGAPSYHELGLLLVRFERYAEALPYLIKAVSLAPSNIEYTYSLASVYRDNKMLDQAIAEYVKVCVLKDDYPNLHNDLGDIYRQKNRVIEANREYQKEISFCEKKLSKNPNDPFTLNDISYAYNRIKDYDRARLNIDKAIILKPDYREAFLTLAMIQRTLGEYDNALVSLEKAKRLSKQKQVFIDNEAIEVKKDQQIDHQSKVNFKPVDTVYLKNGRIFQGIIQKENKESIILKINIGVSVGTVTLSCNDIGRIVKGSKD